MRVVDKPRHFCVYYSENECSLIHCYGFLFPADLSQVWPEANQHFSKEIDDEANSYFQRIYNHPPHPTMSVDEVSSFSASIIPLQI